MINLKMERRFDSKRNRHYLNDHLVVLHCHHYATLFTQLALDSKDIVDGTKILKETSEAVFYEVLNNYYTSNSIVNSQEKAEVAIKMFSAIGMGTMTISSMNEDGGAIEMPDSYLDEGWLKKWGKSKLSVNFIGAGYLAAMFSAVYNKPSQTYKIEELESKAMGSPKSIFKITK